MDIVGDVTANTLELSKSAEETVGQIILRGNNSKIHIGMIHNASNLQISAGSNCSVIIPDNVWIGRLSIHCEDNSSVLIGSFAGFNGAVVLNAFEGKRIEVGKGALFADGVTLVTGDSHSIFDLKSGLRINHGGDIFVEDHVWLCAGVRVMKEVRIGTGSIVAAGAIVTKDIPSQCLAGGVPAKIIREGLAWDHRLTDKILPTEAASPMMKQETASLEKRESNMKLSNYRIEYLHELKAELEAQGSVGRIQFKDADKSVWVPLNYMGFGEKESLAADTTAMDYFDEKSFYVEAPQSFLLQDVVVRLQYGLVTIDDTVLRELMFHFPWFRFQDFKITGEWLKETSCVLSADDAQLEISDAYSAFAGIHQNYYHWLLLFLGRLNSQFIDAWNDGYGTKPALLMPYFANKVQRESAEALAESYRLPVVNIAMPISVKVKRLVFPLPMRSGGLRPHPLIKEPMQILRTKFYKMADYPKKIYISRKDTTNRRMANEQEVENFLQKSGFTVITLEGKSFSDQVNLFAHASHVIGPHGAGLTNISFCEPGAKLFEIQMPSHLNWCYRRLSAVFGIDYGFMFGDLLTDADRHINTREYAVDLFRLEHCLEKGFN